jgi:TonB family protein
VIAVAVAAAGHLALAQDGLPFVVIVHPSNSLTMLTRSEVSNLFLKESALWSDDTVVEPVDLGGESPIREAFSLEIHNRSAGNIRSYWQREIFSGGLVPPLEIESEEQVIDYVRQRPGAIGYVSAGSELDGVKTVAVIDPPVAITRVPPRYTAGARRFRIQGDVRLRLTIGTDGEVVDVEVVEGLGHGLTEQAIQSARKWKFEPATSGGLPVVAPIEVTVQFRL